ncbi:hypothetical protein M569_08810 [Genlisea aurea]|uniref:CNH domain-containing protein n=1 Tax=Genlisea aurea TaxID=192259 RepID=S8CMF8_9LAMI|nr:hypothetical protein M569_08810 [Genlisea aurea]
MAVKPRSRAVIEQFAESTVDSDYSPIKSLSISRLPDDQVLIYVATVSGVLFLYSLRTSQSSPQIAFVRRASLPGAGGEGSVSSIHALAHIGKIIVVSDGLLFLVDSSLLEPAKKLSLFKGVTAFSRRFGSPGYASAFSRGHNNGVEVGNSIAIGSGRKLILAELILSGSLVIQKEIQGGFDGGVLLTLLWIDDSIFFGTRSGYYLYKYSTGKCGLIFSFPEEASFIPQLKLFSKESRVLLVTDNVGIVVDLEGDPFGGSLVFNGVPDMLKETGSYVVASRGLAVELYHKKTGCCVQRVAVGNGTEGHCLLADEEIENGKYIFIATSFKSSISKSKLICYSKVSEEEQIKDLLRKKHFKEAISLVEELENEGDITKEMLSFVHAQVGLLLLFDLQFREAIDHFLLAENMQPLEVFPFILRDPNRWTLLVPRNRYWGLHPPPKLLENVVDDGLNALQRAVFLKSTGVDAPFGNGFLQNPPSRADLLQSAIENMIRHVHLVI